MSEKKSALDNRHINSSLIPYSVSNTGINAPAKVSIPILTIPLIRAGLLSSSEAVINAAKPTKIPAIEAKLIYNE